MNNAPRASQALDGDTIAAIATAPGRGGIGVIRLSGPKALDIGKALTGQTSFTPRLAHYARFVDSDTSVLDDGLLLFFPGPHSFTGEDVVEIQGHGGPVVLNLLLQRCFALGARQARPGEFSERAFLNDKLDLVQAEAIADLINAQTQTAARQARASLSGTFSDAINELATAMVGLRVYVEAAIDFPEEEIDFLSEGHVSQRLALILEQGRQLRHSARQGALIRNGATVVLAGRPNAGKSSLLNTLAGDQIAIVTDQPGTTRDVLREHIELEGVPIYLTDTAGLRESDDHIEQEGVRRAHSAMAKADLIVHLIDDSSSEPEQTLTIEGPVLRVLNKIDLTGRQPGREHAETVPTVAISTRTGEGLPSLKETLLMMIGLETGSDTVFSARERHLTALDDTLAILTEAEQQFLASGAGELLAEDLRQAHNTLGEITGKMSSDELLGEIFSSFCIGK